MKEQGTWQEYWNEKNAYPPRWVRRYFCWIVIPIGFCMAMRMAYYELKNEK